MKTCILDHSKGEKERKGRKVQKESTLQIVSTLVIAKTVSFVFREKKVKVIGHFH